nr:MAG TPA: hypothetical protein [Caudoviricetes sp.]
MLKVPYLEKCGFVTRGMTTNQGEPHHLCL